jgi:hypothetical protein
MRSRERNAGRETTRAIRAVQMSAGDKDRSASTASVVRSRRPGHVTQPKSTNTARLICWRICRDQVPAAFSAARGRAGAAASRSGNDLDNNSGSQEPAETSGAAEEPGRRQAATRIADGEHRDERAVRFRVLLRQALQGFYPMGGNGVARSEEP